MTENNCSLDFKKGFLRTFYPLVIIIQNLFSLLIGDEKCACCSKKCLRIPLCRSCLRLFMNTRKRRTCKLCGRILISEIDLCLHCRSGSLLKDIDGFYSLKSYSLWNKKILFEWKMAKKRTLSPYFAKLIYEKLKDIEKIIRCDIAVVPVPPRKGKIRESGWDQMEEICFYLEKGWGINVLRILERVSSVQQKKLGRKERIASIKSSYILKEEKKLSKILKRMPNAFVLIDDVRTTGSTLEACARQLKKITSGNVYALTLFSVD